MYQWFDILIIRFIDRELRLEVFLGMNRFADWFRKLMGCRLIAFMGLVLGSKVIAWLASMALLFGLSLMS